MGACGGVLVFALFHRTQDFFVKMFGVVRQVVLHPPTDFDDFPRGVIEDLKDFPGVSGQRLEQVVALLQGDFGHAFLSFRSRAVGRGRPVVFAYFLCLALIIPAWEVPCTPAGAFALFPGGIICPEFQYVL